MRRVLEGVLFLLLIALVSMLAVRIFSGAPEKGKAPQGVLETYLPDGGVPDGGGVNGGGVRVEVWAEGLEIPWSLVFMPPGKPVNKAADEPKNRALVSERPGRIRLIKDGSLQPEPYAVLDVSHTGEGGLMGLAVHPNFPKEPYVYAMHTYRKGLALYNKVVRLKDVGARGTLDKTIIDGIPGGRVHDGGRIVFGPDGMLYITTGETGSSEIAQNIKSLGGKILRVTPGGGIPGDNPFKGSPVFSYGHRNPQGLAWHPGTGDLFESEHGPSGEFGFFGHDEINVITRGGNYGWPEAVGAPSKKGYIDPIIVWEEATPPSGMVFYKGGLLKGLSGDLFVATLRSRSLIRVRVEKEGKGNYRVKAIERWFTEKYGRLRDIVEGPDGALYFLTSNRDGRGGPSPGDDRIYRILPD